MRHQRLLGLILLPFAAAIAHGENQGLVVRDQTLGAGRGQAVGPGLDPLSTRPVEYLIPAEMGDSPGDKGANLFHSFARFGIGSGETATFTGPQGDLLNTRSGIANVIVRVTGSEGTDIEGILRSTLFNADLFLMNPHGVIFGPDSRVDVQGSVHVAASRTLEMADGSVFEASVTGPTLAVAPVASFGFLSGASGDVVVRGAQLLPAFGASLTGINVRVLDGALVGPSRINPGREGAVTVLASDTVEIGGRSPEGPFGAGLGRDPDSVRSDPLNPGALLPFPQQVDRITVRARDVVLRDGGRLDASSTRQPGQPLPTRPGVIDVQASDEIRISGDGRSGLLATQVSSQQFGGSPSTHGIVSLDARKVTIEDGLISTTAFSDGALGGDIAIHGADRVSIEGRTQVQSKSFASAGAGGRVSIRSEGEIRIAGPAVISTSTDSPATAGTVLLEAPLVAIGDGASITSGSKAPAAGPAGSVAIRGGRLIEISGRSSVTTTTVSGSDAGAISLRADMVRLESGAEVSSASFSTGRAGTIQVEAADSLVQSNSSISTSALLSDGGDIRLQAGWLVHLRDADVTAEVSNGVGGNVTIDPVFVVLENSRIKASATAGTGGNILITADHVFKNPASILDASSQTGVNGSVEIRSPTTDLQGALMLPEATVQDATELMRGTCQAAASHSGSFIVRPTTAVGPTPDGPLGSGAQGPQIARGNGTPLQLASFSRDTWSLDGCPRMGLVGPDPDPDHPSGGVR